MGSRSTTRPGEFALSVADYFAHLVDQRGGDNSGRWLEEHLGDRGRETWRKLQNGISAMNTNDIEIVATYFEQTPYEFIRNARRWNRGRTEGAAPADLHVVEIPDDIAASTDGTAPDPDRGRA